VKNIIVLAGLWAVLYGCSYTVPTTTSPAENIYSFDKYKIQGPVVLVIDEGLKNIEQKVRPLSSPCSGYRYPLKMESSFADSIKKTTEEIFTQVLELNTLPTKEELKERNSQGTIYVSLNRFNPALWVSNGTAFANCEIVLDVAITDSNDNDLLVATVSGARLTRGDSGGFCKKAATVLSDAIFLSLRETMERYAERISNSEKIRNAFGPRGK
jgi:hypothetical protein